MAVFSSPVASFVFLTPVPSLPICPRGSIIASLLTCCPICLLFLPLLRSVCPLTSLRLSPLLLPPPPWGSLPHLSGAPLSFQALSGLAPPTSFPALKGKNIHVSLTSSGLPERQTSLCVCLPWSQLRPLSLGTLLIISWLEKYLHVSLWLCPFVSPYPFISLYLCISLCLCIYVLVSVYGSLSLSISLSLFPPPPTMFFYICSLYPSLTPPPSPSH